MKFCAGEFSTNSPQEKTQDNENVISSENMNLNMPQIHPVKLFSQCLGEIIESELNLKRFLHPFS